MAIAMTKECLNTKDEKTSQMAHFYIPVGRLPTKIIVPTVSNPTKICTGCLERHSSFAMATKTLYVKGITVIYRVRFSFPPYPIVLAMSVC